MAIQKLLQGGGQGRVLARVSTNHNHTFVLSSKTESHGLMASSLRRKNLVCFYCNKRSDIKYDGFITQWECAKCDSVNFLDEVCSSLRQAVCDANIW